MALLRAQRDSWAPEAVRRLGAHFQWLVAERYEPGSYLQLGYPPAPPDCGLFYAYALIGLAGRVGAQQAADGIDPAITAATIADIGQHVRLHERLYGEVGLAKGWWLCHHLAGHLFRIGRLQFQRTRAARHHSVAVSGQPLLDVHIPEGGTLDPEACDRSFRAAGAFMGRHFPQHGARWFACSSWLLDPVLGELLPSGSNILAFQRRFRITHIESRLPSRIFEHVFYRPELDAAANPDVSALAASSTLHRAIIDHYRAGRRIRPATGLIEIAGP